MTRPNASFTALLLVVSTITSPSIATAQAKDAAILTGKVFSDTSFKPVVGVEVTLPQLSKSAATNEKGVFRIGDIPPGTYLVRARRIGYLAFEENIEFRKGKTVDQPIVLPRISALDSVRVVGQVYTPISYLEHRAMGLGHFITREDLEKLHNIQLPSILSQVSGAGIVFGKGNKGWILSKRVGTRLERMQPRRGENGVPGQDFWFPATDFEKGQGMVPGCYARVYHDGSLLNAGTYAEPIDVNEFMTKNIEAIEYYASPAQTPSRYAKLNAACGVLVIHSRRSP